MNYNLHQAAAGQRVIMKPMQPFEDHFSEAADTYAQYRPQYPGELFAYLSSVAPAHNLAWDCGTGNGQAATGLVNFFDRVIATDASADQLAHAMAHARIEYRAAAAEEPGLAPGSANLISVATAVHWFDLPRFYQTVRQVASPGGVLAVWTYHMPVIEPAVDRVLTHFYQDILSGYWPELFHYVHDHYRTLPFPFPELNSPAFEMRAQWTLDQFAGFVASWSGVRRFQAARGYLPLRDIWPELLEAWGDPAAARVIRWPIYLRVGRVMPGG